MIQISQTQIAWVSPCSAAAAQKEGVEVLFCGKQSMDGDNAQVPSMLGELLDWVTVPVIP